MRRWIGSILLVTACSAAAVDLPHGGSSVATRAEPLPSLQAELDGFLEDPGFSQAFWGILVQELRSGQVLFSRNPDRLFMPASNMKLITTATALLRSDPDRRPVTALYAAGSIEGGILDGDLLLVGGGDPSLGGRFALPDPLSGSGDPWPVMRALADSVRAAGISRISGRVVGVDEYFAEEPLGYGWSWDDLSYGYSAPVSALTWNEGVVLVVTNPGSDMGDPAAVRLVPDVGALRLDARVRTEGPLAGRGVVVVRDPASELVRVRGSISISVEADTATVSVPDPTLFAALGLRAALTEIGVEVDGGAMDQDSDPVAPHRVVALEGSGLVPPSSALRLAAVYGPTVSELVWVTNKVSQNLYAETLLRLIPAWRRGRGSVAEGRGEAEQALTALGIAPQRYVQRDGSGLSRYNYLSPEVLVRLLRGMDRSDRRVAWHASLPVMGVDGTLQERGSRAPLAGVVWAKTGYIANSRALSGYLVTQSGDTLTFSMMANNFTDPSRSIEYVQDLICERLLFWDGRGR